MKRRIFTLLCFLSCLSVYAQNAILTAWQVNTTSKKASYWKTTQSGPSVTYSYVTTTILADVTQMCYSTDSVWVSSEGMTNDMGKYLNPGSCSAQAYIFRFPRVPTVPTTKTKSPYVGAIGLLINGIPVYGLSNSNSWTGSAMSPMGAGVWNAEVGYNEGFVLDTAFGAHPQQNGAYHTHATPFRLYKNVSTSQHSPIVGYAFDGYPIYGPYGYSNATNSSSAVTRMKTGYALRNITTRTTLPDGSTASQTGPTVNATYPLGYFIEDYAWSAANGGDLDQYNGRYCVTPEYPGGTYAYFTTIDAAGDAAFPYYIGTTYYGDPEDANLAINPTITMPTSGTSCQNTTGITPAEEIELIVIYPNPAEGQISISVDNTSDEFAEVFMLNQLNQKIYSSSLSIGQNQVSPQENLSSGLYVVGVRSKKDNSVISHKLMVK